MSKPQPGQQKVREGGCAVPEVDDNDDDDNDDDDDDYDDDDDDDDDVSGLSRGAAVVRHHGRCVQVRV